MKQLLLFEEVKKPSPSEYLHSIIKMVIWMIITLGTTYFLVFLLRDHGRVPDILLIIPIIGIPLFGYQAYKQLAKLCVTLKEAELYRKVGHIQYFSTPE